MLWGSFLHWEGLPNSLDLIVTPTLLKLARSSEQITWWRNTSMNKHVSGNFTCLMPLIWEVHESILLALREEFWTLLLQPNMSLASLECTVHSNGRGYSHYPCLSTYVCPEKTSTSTGESVLDSLSMRILNIFPTMTEMDNAWQKEVGDHFLLKDKQTSHDYWPMARITATVPGHGWMDM